MMNTIVLSEFEGDAMHLAMGKRAHALAAFQAAHQKWDEKLSKVFAAHGLDALPDGVPVTMGTNEGKVTLSWESPDEPEPEPVADAVERVTEGIPAAVE